MDRRRFLTLSATGLIGLGLSDSISILDAKCRRDTSRYSIVILGDTHFDTEPASVYHSDYNEPEEWLNRVQRAEFARNGEMWRDRCPRLVRRAVELVDKDTRMVMQMGDLIQGDCGNPAVHARMLDDVMNMFKGQFGGLPFLTVAGNHDVRGTGAAKAYMDYMPARMGRELGRSIGKTTFSFTIGEDVYIFVDFNAPDDEELEMLLEESRGARHTFVVSHGPIFPYDGSSARWFLHGGRGRRDTAARRHFRELLAQRNAIVLCGHTHRTEFMDWQGDGGRITQMTMNSVWSKDKEGRFVVDSEGPEMYGELRKGIRNDKGEMPQDETPLFDEYRPGVRSYLHSPSAGSYKLNVSRRHVTVDFYAGDSQQLSHRFLLR